jgi:hypothetical protein
MNGGFSAPADIARFKKLALIVGAIATVIFLIGAVTQHEQFFHAYLVAYIFWTGIALGSLALLMLQHLTGGHWGLVIRRLLEASTRTLPLMALLFVPIVLGARSIYPWTNEQNMETPALKVKMHYLNLPFFTLRAAIYFAFWIGVAFFLNRWSLEQDRTADRRLAKNMRMLSGPGLVFFIITVTLAAIDWGMSLRPEWSSTIYGLLYVAAWSLTALAFTIAVMAILGDREPMSHVVKPSHFQDLGKLLLALVMLWVYFAFSQFLIIWAGNIPEEIHYYLPRVKGAWGVIALLVVIFNFALPFLMLLSRRTKRDPHRLVIVAVLVLIMRLVDVCWMIEPEFAGENFHGFHMNWWDFIAPFAIGGIWLACFFWQLEKRPLIPFGDPQFESLMTQAHSSH